MLKLVIGLLSVGGAFFIGANYLHLTGLYLIGMCCAAGMLAVWKV